MSESEKKVIKGVKYTRDIKTREIIFVYLECYNEFRCHDGFYTTDCVITNIENPATHKKMEKVDGHAYHSFKYFVGQRITDEKIFYCHNVDELLEQHVSEKDGSYSTKTVREMLSIGTKKYGSPGILGILGLLRGILEAGQEDREIFNRKG